MSLHKLNFWEVRIDEMSRTRLKLMIIVTLAPLTHFIVDHKSLSGEDKEDRNDEIW